MRGQRGNHTELFLTAARPKKRARETGFAFRRWASANSMARARMRLGLRRYARPHPPRQPRSVLLLFRSKIAKPSSSTRSPPCPVSTFSLSDPATSRSATAFRWNSTTRKLKRPSTAWPRPPPSTASGGAPPRVPPPQRNGFWIAAAACSTAGGDHGALVQGLGILQRARRSLDQRLSAPASRGKALSAFRHAILSWSLHRRRAFPAVEQTARACTAGCRSRSRAGWDRAVSNSVSTAPFTKARRVPRSNQTFFRGFLAHASMAASPAEHAKPQVRGHEIDVRKPGRQFQVRTDRHRRRNRW